MAELSASELAYIAGFIDADGSIGVARHNRNLTLSVQAAQKNPVILHWLVSKAGGKIYTFQRSTTYNKETTTYYKWCLHGRPAQNFVMNIEPYLIQKKTLAELALIFPIGSRKLGMGGGLSGGDIVLREQIYNRMKELNHQ